MSINKSVGGLSLYLSRLRSSPEYYNVKKDVKYILSKTPLVGDDLIKIIERFKNSFKYIVLHGILFEELGFTYIGPINGHDIKTLIHVFNRARSIHGPVMIHVITVKGKGYALSEATPEKYHGVAPFDPDNDQSGNAEAMTFTKAFEKAGVSISDIDKKVVTITAAMKDNVGLGDFANKYPERFFDVGIAEQHAVTLAAGMAAAGMKPVVAIYSTFLQRAYDQIIHDVCMQNLPVIFAIDRSGLVGEDGETHHGVFDISFLRSMPNMTILSPKDGVELQEMLFYASSIEGPVAIRYPKSETQMLNKCQYDITNMKEWQCLRDGNDIAIFAVGRMVKFSFRVANLLYEMGIDAKVINSRCIKPLDRDFILKTIHTVKRVVTIEENVKAGGFGSSVMEFLQEQKIENIDIHIIAIPDRFISHGAVEELLKSI